MLKILRHGNVISVRNPVSGKFEDMVNVTFVEIGRSGANDQLSDSTNFLNSLTGEQTGLAGFRIHTQPVLKGKEAYFPVGSEIPGHINRKMYSKPQMRAQEDVPPQLVDGRPTYFTTWLSGRTEDDVDNRISNEVLLASDPSALDRVIIEKTERKVLQEAQNSGDPEGILAVLTGQTTNVDPKVVANRNE